MKMEIYLDNGKRKIISAEESINIDGLRIFADNELVHDVERWHLKKIII